MKTLLHTIVLFSILAAGQTAPDPLSAKMTKMTADIQAVGREFDRHVAVEREFFQMTHEIMALKDPKTLDIIDRRLKRIEKIVRKP